MEQKLMEKESSRRQQEIDNHIYLAREKSLADANYYRYFSHFAFKVRNECLLHRYRIPNDINVLSSSFFSVY